MLQAGAFDIPLPGAGTRRRWEALARWGSRDLVLARLAEGHTDAVAILAEAGHPPVERRLLGVWASASEGTGLKAQPDDGRWLVSGTLRFASGARVLDTALVTADSPDGRLLLVLDLGDDAVTPVPGTWQAVGMDDSDSLDVTVGSAHVEAGAAVGPPGFYVQRPGLSVGGMGVAAVWWGGARGIVDALTTALTQRDPTEHQLAHLGACASAVTRGAAVLDRAAVAVDADPGGDHRSLSQHVRHEMEQVADEVVRRAGRITGAGPLCRDAAYARSVADLTVFVRQHHAEADLARLGRATLERRA